ncbi:MAG: hypothetical protein ACI4TT_04285 [Christensenellales bacterium]
MVELFEIIMQYPAQFLAGLGLSSGAIYLIFSGIKGFVKLVTKKSTKLKQIANNNAIAETVVQKIGDMDAIIDKVAETVINKLTNAQAIIEIKAVLTKIANRSDCPIELKAYIETVLSQSGSEQLQLLYEQTKSNLITISKMETTDIIKDGAEKLEQEKESIIENTTNEPTQAQAPSATISTSEDEDIEYA